MAVDILELVNKWGPAVIATCTGWIGAAFNFRSRIEKLEKEFALLVDNHKKSIDEARKSLEEKNEELAKEIKAIDDAFIKFERASHADFAKDAELARFIEEEQRQWQAIQRTLGQIEGILKSSKSWNPPPLQAQSTYRSLPKNSR